MKRLILGLLILTSIVVHSEVVRLAPNFGLQGTGTNSTLRSFQGKSVVLIVAKSATDHRVKDQVEKLKELYQEFASRQVIFIAALQDPSSNILSDIPFVLAKDGNQVAVDYSVKQGDFNLMIIGKDGNVDLQTSKVCSAARGSDVLINSFVVQSAARR